MSGDKAMNSDNTKKKGINMVPKSSEKDNRYLPRWEVQNRILYRLEDGQDIHEGCSKDISCSGACVFVPEIVLADQKIKLKIYLSDEDFVEVDGKILWNKFTEEGNLVGINFCNTAPDVQDLIFQHAFEIKKEEIIQHFFKGWDNN